jgi:hypothetical protein
VSVDQLAKWNTHLLLNCNWVVNMPTDAEKLCSLVLISTKPGEPRSSSSHYGRDDRDSLNVCHSRRAPIQTGVSWEGRLQSGSAWLALKALNQSRLFSADICSGARLDVNIEIVATSASIFANEALSISFINCPLKLNLLVPEFTANIEVGSLSSHAETNDESTLDKLVRIMS